MLVEEVFAAFEKDSGSRVGGVHLRHRGAEMVVDRRAFPEALVYAFLLAQFEIAPLQNHTHALNQEHATEYRQQQLLVHNHSRDSNDAADGQAARVAHEDLRRESVVPQETYQSAHESSQENNQLLTVRNVHHIEIVRQNIVARHIRQHNERNADYR